MKRNPSYITRLLEASTVDEAYRVRQELEEKLKIGFNPDEIRDFINELLDFLYDYKLYKKRSDILKEFAKMITDVLSAEV